MSESKLRAPYEPKCETRFNVIWPADTGLNEVPVLEISRPRFEYTPFTGSRWQPVNVIFQDNIASPASLAIYELLQKFEENRTAFGFEIFMESLDPVGVVVEKWRIGVTSIAAIDFGKHTVNTGKVRGQGYNLDHTPYNFTSNGNVAKVSVIFSVDSCDLLY